MNKKEREFGNLLINMLNKAPCQQLDEEDNQTWAKIFISKLNAK